MELNKVNNAIKIAIDTGKYKVKPNGDIIGIRKQLKSYIVICKRGYKLVKTTISLNGKSYSVTASRMVAYAKYGDDMFKKGIEVRHLNGNSTDNSFKNIAIGTHSQNMMDLPVEIRKSKAKRAQSFIKYKYSENKEKIKDFYNKTKSYKKTMLEFGISSKGTLWFILNK